MRPWKAALGVGAACAACCAVPLLGGAAALGAGTTTLAALGSALWACADDVAPLVGVVLALVTAGSVAIWWVRRARRPLQQAVGCEGSCHASRS